MWDFLFVNSHIKQLKKNFQKSMTLVQLLYYIGKY